MKKGAVRSVIFLVLLFVFQTAAWGQLAYTTVDASYTSGTLGILEGQTLKASPNRIVGLTGDTAVFAFERSGEPYLLLADRTAQNGDVVYVYQSSQGWGKPLFNEKWSAVSNLHAVAAENSLFVASHNNGQIVRVDSASFKVSGTPYAPAAPEGYSVQATGVAYAEGHIYALFSYRTGNWPNFEYLPSKLVKLDTGLNKISETEVGKNAVQLLYNSRDKALYIAYWGGAFYNAVGGVQKYTPGSGKTEQLLETDKLGGGGVVSLTVSNSGGLYFILQRYSDEQLWQVTSTLWRVDADQPVKMEDISASSGFSYQLAWDSEENLLWVLRGDRILALGAEGTLKKTFTNAELGGNPYMLAPIPGSGEEKPEKGGSGGGCNANGGIAALLLLPMLLYRKGRSGR